MFNTNTKLILHAMIHANIFFNCDILISAFCKHMLYMLDWPFCTVINIDLHLESMQRHIYVVWYVNNDNICLIQYMYNRSFINTTST